MKMLMVERAGQMTLPLPPYIYSKYDQEAKKVTLSVGDPKIAHQRAMWGMSLSLFLTIPPLSNVTFLRTTSQRIRTDRALLHLQEPLVH